MAIEIKQVQMLEIHEKTEYNCQTLDGKIVEYIIKEKEVKR